MARQVFTTPSARMSQKYETTLRYLEDSNIRLNNKEKIFLKSFIKGKTEKFNRGQWWQKIQTPSSQQLGDEFKNIMSDYHNPDIYGPDDVVHPDDVSLKEALENPNFSSIENSVPDVSNRAIATFNDTIENASHESNPGERTAMYGTIDSVDDDATLYPVFNGETENPLSTPTLTEGHFEFFHT